jgi:homogentisate 1,2-dioxygenase
MSLKKFRWSKVYESSEEELVETLQALKIQGERIHAESDAEQIERQSDGDSIIWCAEGSLVIVSNTNNISLQPGDALRLEAGTTYSVQPGIANCVYYLTR